MPLDVKGKGDIHIPDETSVWILYLINEYVNQGYLYLFELIME